MIPFVKKYLFDNWESLKLGERPKDILFIKFADRRIRAAEVAVVSFLVKVLYHSNKEVPLLILRALRYPDSPDANMSLEMECRNLSRFYKELKNEKILSVIPKPIFWEEINSSRVFAISFLPGKSLSRFMLSRDLLKSYVDNFNLAFSWLVAFQKTLGSGISLSAEAIMERVTAEYLKVFPQMKSAREKYFAKLKNTAKKLNGKEIPLFAQHGDYHAENVFIDNNQVSGIIDWEDFNEHGVPCFDLFHFIKTYFEALFNYSTRMKDFSILEKLSTDKQALNIVRATVENYFKMIGTDPRLIAIFVPLYLIQSASLAGDPRKRALGALKKIEILLRLEPHTINDLFLYMSVFNFGDLLKRASFEKDEKLVNMCRGKIQRIQEIAKSRKAG